MYEECEVVNRLQEQQDYILEMRNMLEYQVSLQTSLVREVDCLKDQLDTMRERWHNLSDTSGRYEDDGLGFVMPSRDKLPSLRSEACLVSTMANSSQHNLMDSKYSQFNTQSIVDNI